jgi:HK97 family phage major capsid protein
MLSQQIKEKTAEVGVKLRAWRGLLDASKWDEAQAAKDEYSEANAELQTMSRRQRDYEEAKKAEEELLAPDPAKAVQTKHPEEPKPSKADRSELVDRVHMEMAALYYRGSTRAQCAAYCEAEGLQADEIATLIAGDSAKGGILIQPDWGATYEGRVEPWIMRALVDVQPTTSDVLVVPKITSELTADAWMNEGEEHTTRQDIDTGGVEIKVNPWHPLPVVVSELLASNPGANIVSIITNRIMRRKGLDEDNAMLNGTGVGRPMGILNESGITTVPSLDAATLTWPGIINLIYTLGAEWAASADLVMRRLTYATVLGLQDPSGAYAFAANANAAPETLLGYKVHFTDYMPAIAGSANAILFGDFKAYTLAENTGATRVKRLEEVYDPNIGFSTLALLGGKTVDTNGFVIQTISA